MRPPASSSENNHHYDRHQRHHQSTMPQQQQQQHEHHHQQQQHGNTGSMKLSVSMTSLPPNGQQEISDMAMANLRQERPYNSLKVSVLFFYIGVLS